MTPFAKGLLHLRLRLTSKQGDWVLSYICASTSLSQLQNLPTTSLASDSTLPSSTQTYAALEQDSTSCN